MKGRNRESLYSIQEFGANPKAGSSICYLFGNKDGFDTGWVSKNECLCVGGPSRQASWHGDPHFIIPRSVARTRQIVKTDLGPAEAQPSTRGASVRARSHQLCPGGQPKEINTEIVNENKG